MFKYKIYDYNTILLRLCQCFSAKFLLCAGLAVFTVPLIVNEGVDDWYTYVRCQQDKYEPGIYPQRRSQYDNPCYDHAPASHPMGMVPVFLACKGPGGPDADGVVMPELRQYIAHNYMQHTQQGKADHGDIYLHI